MKRKPCGRPTGLDDEFHATHCRYDRMAGKQQCVWHWLLKQPANVQKAHAGGRLSQSAFCTVGADRRMRVPKEEWPPNERWCSGCQSFIPLFYAQGSRCRSCNSEASHAARVQKVYGITPEEYEALFKLQDGKCYICHRTARSRRLAVDHDHKTGEVRGLLCSDSDRGCNKAILGNIKDLAMAKRIVQYLEDPPYSRLLRAASEPNTPAPTPTERDAAAEWVAEFNRQHRTDLEIVGGRSPGTQSHPPPF